MPDQDAVARLNVALTGRYRVERQLGEGGMATVYLAEDLPHQRKVALKVLKPELAAVVGAERFLAEIRTTANLQHPLPEKCGRSSSATGPPPIAPHAGSCRALNNGQMPHPSVRFAMCC
jgi:serine/threonine protein kinase